MILVFDIHIYTIELTLSNMFDYLNVVHEGIAKKQKEFESVIEEKTAGLDQEGRDEYFHNYCLDDHWRLYEIVPNYFYSSFLITWYSFIEKELFTLCKLIRIDKDIILKHDELAGRGIRQAQTYFASVLNVELAERDWKELIDKIAKLRNVYAHRCGEFSEREIDNLRSYLNLHQLYDYGRVVLTVDYCKYLIAFARRLLQRLYYDAGYTKSPTDFESKERDKVKLRFHVGG